VSGCANPCGGEGRVGNRPLGGEGPEQALGGSGGWDSRSGLGVGMEGLGVHRGLRLELGHSKASAPAPEDRGPHSRRDPRSGRPRKQRSTEAQPFRGRVGERSCAQLQRRPRDRKGFQVNSDPRMARPASAPQGSGRSLCSWWQVSGAGSPAWAAFRKGFREGLCLLRVQGRRSWSGSRGRRPPSMGVG
jgi:hypothetical protein